ncbi:MAG: hypothetical protein ABSE05_06895 [Syntrophales bacterium]|jgi:hypothetical protein
MAANNLSPPERKATYSPSEENKFIDKVRSNVKSDLIEITADKLENILLKHLHKLGIRRSWATPLPVFITALLASLTATFSDKFGINGSVWQAFFLLVVCVTVVWLVVALIMLCACWKTSSLEHLIGLIKNAQKDGQQEASRSTTVLGGILKGRKDMASNVPITNGLAIWLDASDISSLFQTSDGKEPVKTENQLVGLWRDKSGNDNHFSQSQQGARPLFVKTGIGSKPSVMFNTGQSILMTRNLPAPVTVIYVARQIGGSNKRVLSAMMNNWLLGYWRGAKNQAYYEGWVSTEGSPATDYSPHVFAGIVRGPGQNSEVWADGSMVAINPNGITGPNGLAINTGAYPEEVSDCQVAEIIVFNRDISQSERQEVEVYLKAKWGIN